MLVSIMSPDSRQVKLDFFPFTLSIFMDWSLIMGRGGATKREGGHVKFYPYEKRGGGGRKVLAILKGGHKKFWGSFYAVG